MDLRRDILPHSDRLYRLALSILMDTAEAEDVVQDTILRAWERRNEWESIEHIGAWLTQVCKNLALDRKKRKHSQPLPAEGSTEWQSPSLITNPQDDDVSNIILQIIAELPPPLDDLMRLRDIEGLTYREIAAQLHLTEDQVRVYLHRARTRVREKYTKFLAVS